MNIWVLDRSSNPKKKYMVSKFGSNVHIKFGDPNYEDYTMHNDTRRKIRYLARHHTRENWSNPNTAGFWSANLLWNKSTLDKSIKDIEDRFKLNIINLIQMSLIGFLFMAHVAYNYETYVKMTKTVVNTTIKYWNE